MVINHLSNFESAWLLLLNSTLIKSVFNLRVVHHVIWITIQYVLVIYILQNFRWWNNRTHLWFILSLKDLSSILMIIFVCLMETLICILLLGWRSSVIRLSNWSWLIIRNSLFVGTFVTWAGVILVITDVLIFNLLLDWSSLVLIMLTPKWLTYEIVILLLLFLHLILEFGVTWKTIIFIFTKFFEVLMLWSWLMSNLLTLFIWITALNTLRNVSLLVSILMNHVLSLRNINFWFWHIFLTV